MEKAFSVLPDDLTERLKVVDKFIKVPLETNQRHALLDLYYQGGTDGLKAVTNIINRRDPTDKDFVLASNREAALEMLLWDMDASGQHLEGLQKRRARNVAMFLAGEYGSDLDTIPLWDKVNPHTGKVTYSEMQWYRVKDTDLPERPHNA